MPGMPDSQELYLWIISQYNAAQMKQAMGDVQNINKEIKKYTKESIGGLRGVTQGMAYMLRPLAQIRFTIWRLRYLWMMTFGALVGLVMNASKEMDKMRDQAEKLEMPFEELSKLRYGMIFDPRKVGEVSRMWKEWVDRFKIVGMVVGEWLAKLSFGMGKVSYLTDEQIELMGKLKDETDKLIMSEDEYNKKRIDNLSRQYSLQLELFRDTENRARKVEALRVWQEAQEQKMNFDRSQEMKKMFVIELDLLGQSRDAFVLNQKIEAEAFAKKCINDANRMQQFYTLQEMQLKDYDRMEGLEKKKLFSLLMELRGSERGAFILNQKIELDEMRKKGEEYVNIMEEIHQEQLKVWELEQWGLRSHYQIISDLQKQFGQDTTQLFGDIFIDALDNKLKGSRQIFAAFLIDLRNMLIRSGIEEMLGGMVTGGKKSTNLGTINVVKSIFSMFGGGGGVLTQGAQVGMAAGYQRGGWAGLRGPELAVVGEHEPELIVPTSKLGRREGERQEVKNYFIISAIDSRSFAQIVASNPEAIVAVTADAIRKNKGLRRTIREYT